MSQTTTKSDPEPVTPESCAQRAAALLEAAEKTRGADREGLIEVAAGWRQLSDSLAEQERRAVPRG